MVACGPQLQNAPDGGLVPEEVLVAEIVEEALQPHVESGFLQVERVHGPSLPRRPNLIVTVKGAGEGTIGFVGAHFDVVPADREAEGWERDPFQLWVGEDGTLYARGVTDCLGHIAVLTDLLCQLGEQRLRPERTLKVVMISNEEERPIPECGLNHVVDTGKMDDLKDGTIYWLDSADFGPTVGTGGICTWELDVRGFAGHSGMTQNCVNALELAMASALHLARWFEDAFPAHPDEQRWGYQSASTLKSTVIVANNEKITKIPGDILVRGDIRLTPFYDMKEAIGAAIACVEDLNRRLQNGDPPQGFPRIKTLNGERGSVTLRQKGRMTEGIACRLDSPGLAALTEAIAEVRGEDGVSQFSMTGSLPLVRDLQRSGFDVQITGFGRSTYYHAPNEQANLEHFQQGFDILAQLLRV